MVNQDRTHAFLSPTTSRTIDLYRVKTQERAYDYDFERRVMKLPLLEESALEHVPGEIISELFDKITVDLDPYARQDSLFIASIVTPTPFMSVEEASAMPVFFAYEYKREWYSCSKCRPRHMMQRWVYVEAKAF